MLNSGVPRPAVELEGNHPVALDQEREQQLSLVRRL